MTEEYQPKYNTKKGMAFLSRILPNKPEVVELSPQQVDQTIDGTLENITFRESEIIKLRLGLSADGQVYSLRNLSEKFKITIGRVRSLETKALRKLFPQEYKN